MPRFSPYNLHLQITRLFEQGQSFFATTKVQDWLREHNQDPGDYEIIFRQKAAPKESGATLGIEIELRRRDGHPVDPWLQQEVNRQE